MMKLRFCCLRVKMQSVCLSYVPLPGTTTRASDEKRSGIREFMPASGVEVGTHFFAHYSVPRTWTRFFSDGEARRLSALSIQTPLVLLQDCPSVRISSGTLEEGGRGSEEERDIYTHTHTRCFPHRKRKN